ncbi:tetratricopeptide repeat protein [Pseudactinotalea terrae]|uniref:tetratricopeptide repeat protein n=1 Tax=Pseudactinotalea terrae TaxID=1743262 RepID=UPI0012E316DA|nr:tetratricopeptide repeat protein [Pseudactinotalea terrae]
MTQPPSGLNLRGAVDLSALSQPAPKAGAGGGATAPNGVVIEVTAETFQETVTTSMTVPVVVDLYSARSAASTQLSATLQQLAATYAGKFQLARVDADSNPQIAQAIGAQSLPTTFAIIKGQPLPLFQGAHPAEQIQAVLDELLRAAAENGVTGTISVADAPEAAEEPEEPPLPPHLQAAYDAIENGSFEDAIAGLELAIKQNPGDDEAKALLAQVQLMGRLESVDPVAALTAARDAAPGDVAVQLVAADVEVSTGQAPAAYERLLAAVRASSGDDKNAARARLVDLFLIADPADPAVLKARRDLAIALY